MLRKTVVETDEFEFLRRRAAQLLDDGYEKQAFRLLNIIDKEQLRLLSLRQSPEEKAAP